MIPYLGQPCEKSQRSMAHLQSLHSVVRLFHEGMHAEVQSGSTVSEMFEVKNGLRQGCPIAPTLFNIYFCAMIHTSHPHLCNTSFHAIDCHNRTLQLHFMLLACNVPLPLSLLFITHLHVSAQLVNVLSIIILCCLIFLTRKCLHSHFTAISCQSSHFARHTSPLGLD